MQLPLFLLIFTVYYFPQNTDADGSCGGLIDAESSPEGTILSPGYPDQYPEDVECLWSIQAPPGERVEFSFNDFDMTGSADCSGDYVTFQSTTNNNSMEKRYCGSSFPPSVVSEEETLNFIFKTNGKGSCRGFNASYQLLKETLTCGSYTNAMEFTLVSPNYPESVSNESMQCSLTVSHGCIIGKEREICQMRLEFEEFEIQPPFWGDCKYDSFYVENASPLPILCGNNTGNHMYIDVQGRSKTDLTFLLSNIEYNLYNCYDLYDVLPTINQPIVSRKLHKRDIESVEIGDEESGFAGRYARQGILGTSTTITSPTATSPVPAVTSPVPAVTSQVPAVTSPVPVVTSQVPAVTSPVPAVTSPVSAVTSPVPAVTSSVPAVTSSVPPETPTPVPAVTTSIQSATTSSPASTTTTTKGSTTLFPTVALYDYQTHDITTFSTRRAWKIHVTQIPCTCPQENRPKAPDGCLQYHTDVSATIKSFNYDSLSCYTEDRLCDFDAMQHASDCDIRVGYSGHLNNLDYSICIQSEPGFCGIQYKQIGIDGFSLSNYSDVTYPQMQSIAGVGDESCPADYLWIPDGIDDTGSVSEERHCGTSLGSGYKTGYITTNSKPFTIRAVTDADEFRYGLDYMNKGFHLSYSQIPCNAAG